MIGSRYRGWYNPLAAARLIESAVVRGDPASDRGVAGAADRRGVSWETAPTYLVRDNDGAYGPIFRRRVRAMGIRDRPTSPRSPWQNPYAEPLIGTLRRDCLDHVVIFGARHLRRVLAAYSAYYNKTRTHLSLEKDAPLGRAVQPHGAIITAPIPFRTASLLFADMIFGNDSTSMSAVSMPTPITRANKRTIACGPSLGACLRRSRRASSICRI